MSISESDSIVERTMQEIVEDDEDASQFPMINEYEQIEEQKKTQTYTKDFIDNRILKGIHDR